MQKGFIIGQQVLMRCTPSKHLSWGMQMMQAEMAFVWATNGNNQKENGSRGRSINPNIICHTCEEAGHIV